MTKYRHNIIQDNSKEYNISKPLNIKSCNSHGGTFTKNNSAIELFCVLNKDHEGLHACAAFGAMKSWQDSFDIENYYVAKRSSLPMTEDGKIDLFILNNKMYSDVILLKSKWSRVFVYIKNIIRKIIGKFYGRT